MKVKTGRSNWQTKVLTSFVSLAMILTLITPSIVYSESSTELSGNVVDNIKVSIQNYFGMSDIVTVQDVKGGDIVKVYSGPNASSKLLGSAIVPTGKTSAIITIPQLGPASGSVFVTLTSAGKETERMEFSFPSEGSIAAPETGMIAIKNLVGVADTIEVTALLVGDTVKVYDAAGTRVLGTATVPIGKNVAVVNVAQLGQGAGAVNVTLTRRGYLESEKTTKEYAAEEKAPVVKEEAISIKNLVGVTDTIEVIDLLTGDSIKVYDVAGTRVLGTATVPTGKSVAVVSVAQLGQAAGRVQVTLTRRGFLESDKTSKEYDAEQKAPDVKEEAISIKNLVGVADTIEVIDLLAGDSIKVYDAAGTRVLGTATVPTGKSVAVVSVAQLGQAAGRAQVTLTRRGFLESDKTSKEYDAEQKAPAVKEEAISIKNLVGVTDTIEVIDLLAGDSIKVYDAAGTRVLGTATVLTGKSVAVVSVAQLGQVAGRVQVTLTRRGYLESEKTTKAYAAEEKAPAVKEESISIKNLVGVTDTIEVIDLLAGDSIKVYDAAGTRVLGTATVPTGKSVAVVSVAQLGQAAGRVQVTLTRRGYLESEKTTKAYAAEEKAPAVKEESISIKNLVGVTDTIEVTDLQAGDSIKVYDVAGTRVLGTATVPTGKNVVVVNIAQLGQGKGSVQLTLTRRGFLESDKTTKEYAEEQKAPSPSLDKIMITNNVALADTVEVLDLQANDVIKVYSQDGTKVLGTGTVASGKTSVIVTVSQLGQTSGKVYITITRRGYVESLRVEKDYDGEAKSQSLSVDVISITNKKNQPDVIDVKDLEFGDVVKVYSASELTARLLGSATVPSGKTSVSIVVSQLGLEAGTVYLTRTQKGKIESDRVPKAFTGEGQLIEAIAKVNAAVVYDSQSDDDYFSAVEAMKRALENPILALDFGQLYPAFNDRQKRLVYSRMGGKAYTKSFATKEEIQVALTQIIQIIFDREPAYQEAQKYVKFVTVDSDLEAGTILNQLVIKLQDGKQSDIAVKMTVSGVEGGTESSPRPAQYLAVDSKGTLKLRQKNNTNQAVLERVIVRFANLTGTYDLYINVRILPTQKDEMYAAIEKINKAVYADGSDYMEQEAAAYDMLEAIQSDILDLNFGTLFESFSESEKRSVASSLITRIKYVNPFVSKEEIQMELTSTIQQVFDNRPVSAETEKYVKSARIDSTIEINTDITHTIIQLLSTAKPDPSIKVEIDHIADADYQKLKTSEYLTLYSNHRILLKKKNTTGKLVVERVVLHFSSGSGKANSYLYIEVKILPEMSSEVAEAIARINAVTLSDDANYEERVTAIENMLEALQSPILGLDFGDSFKNFTEDQRNDVVSFMISQVKYSPFNTKDEVQEALTQNIQEIVEMQPLLDERDKYQTNIGLGNEILAGTDVTDQIIQLYDGEIKNPNIIVELTSAKGKGNKPAQYLSLSNGRILYGNRNETGEVVYEYVTVRLRTQQRSAGFVVTVGVSPSLSPEEAVVIAKVNGTKFTGRETPEEREATIKQMKNALSDPLLQLEVNDSRLTNSQLQEILGLVIDRVSSFPPFKSMREIRDYFNQQVVYVIEREFLYDEMLKYYFAVTLKQQIGSGTDVTKKVIQVREGLEVNPEIEVTIVSAFGGTFERKVPSEYLKIRNGKVILEKQNTTDKIIKEYVQLSVIKKGTTTSTGPVIEVSINPNIISEELEALNKINAIQVKDYSNEEEVSAALEALQHALRSPALGLNFGEEFERFSQDAKQIFYLNLALRLKYELFSSKAELQLYLDSAIGRMVNADAVNNESRKYYRQSILSRTSQLGDDVTNDIVRLMTGEVINPDIAVTVQSIEGTGGNNKPAEFLGLDDNGRIILLKENGTGSEVVEHVQLRFANSKTGTGSVTVGIRIDVTIQPKQESSEGGEVEAVAKVNAVTISANPSKTELSDAIHEMKEALANPSLELRFGEVFAGFSAEQQQDTYSRMVYHVKSLPFESREDIQRGLEDSIQRTVNLYIAFEEMDKYATNAEISGELQVGDDVTDQIIRMTDGETENPNVVIMASDMKGDGGNERPAKYLAVDEHGRITLKQVNNSDKPVIEYVYLWFTVGTTSAITRVDVQIEPAISSLSTEDEVLEEA
ncbi:hypothetical protein [Brevibacillus choshinensis]|uniref:hypothetical protein n=1 Tax=Brevibacillus choshinensis TaxID=54911 RepID=UPI00128FAABB|nr:hypothetical protein [Brevibacillus choshinensis]